MCSCMSVCLPGYHFHFLCCSIQLVDDLVLLGVRAGGGQDGLETLNHSDYSGGINYHYVTWEILHICPLTVL